MWLTLLKILKKNWILYAIGGFIITAFVYFMRSPIERNEAEVDHDLSFKHVEENLEKLPEEEEKIYVDVKGEVKQPGIYEMESDARIQDAIVLAGGFTSEANEITVNLAQKVHDEMSIIVPSLEEDSSQTETISNVTNGKVRINYASQEEIETLSGIGPSKAKTILEYREEHGFFKEVDDLLNISGIGEKTLDNIRDELQIP